MPKILAAKITGTETKPPAAKITLGLNLERITSDLNRPAKIRKKSRKFCRLKYLLSLPEGIERNSISGYCRKKLFSGPLAVPINKASRLNPFSLRACQTAMVGLTEPKVPPPLKTIFMELI